MSERKSGNITGEASSVSRRDWLKSATGVVAGGALGVTLPTVVQADAPAASQAPACSGTRVATPDDIVETTAGRVRGFTRNGVYIFRGMPYGDTTAGANRFSGSRLRRCQGWRGFICRRI